MAVKEPQDNPMRVKLTWSQAWVSVSMTRPPWTRDYWLLGPRYQAHIPRGPAYSVTNAAGHSTWRLVGNQLDPAYHEQS